MEIHIGEWDGGGHVTCMNGEGGGGMNNDYSTTVFSK